MRPLSLAIVPGTAHATYQGSAPAPITLGNDLARTIAVDPATGMAYVPTMDGGGATASVYAIDLATDKVVAAIPVPVEPTTITVDPATISGTPATSANGKTYVIRLTATNKVGATATQRFTIKVS